MINKHYKGVGNPCQNYRRVCSCVSQRAEYRLSELCENLILVLAFMWNWGESYKVRYIWCGIFNYGKLLSHISTMSASVYASLSSRAFNAFTFWAKEKHPEGCSLRKCYAIIFIGNIGHA